MKTTTKTLLLTALAMLSLPLAAKAQILLTASTSTYNSLVNTEISAATTSAAINAFLTANSTTNYAYSFTPENISGILLEDANPSYASTRGVYVVGANSASFGAEDGNPYIAGGGGSYTYDSFVLPSSGTTYNALSFDPYSLDGNGTDKFTFTVTDSLDNTYTSPTISVTQFSTQGATFEGIVDENAGAYITSIAFNNISGSPADSELTLGTYTVATVPEPSTWALMLGGLGLLVWITRWRKSSVI